MLTALGIIPNKVFRTNVVTPGVVIVVLYLINFTTFSGLYNNVLFHILKP